MALAEELLDNIPEEQAIEYAMIESKPHIVIDEDRNIVLPERYKMIAAQGDHNVATYTFDCPRFSDGRDMSEMVVYINYIRSDGVPGSYPADNVTIDEQNANLMHFEWTLLLPATLEAGVLAFLVCVCKSGDDGKIENHWSSRMCREAMISEGMDCHADIIVDLYPDVITRILERLNILEGGGAASVQYTVQNLEEEQKVQARKNIGAASAEEMACKWVLISNGETKTKIDGSSYEVPPVIKCVIPNAGGDITFEEKNSFSLQSKNFTWQSGGLREEIYRVEENTVITVSANISVYILDDKGYSYLKKDINKLSEDIADLKENGTGDYTTPCVFFTSTEILSLTNKDTEVMAEVEARIKNKIIRGYASVKWQGSSSLSYNKKNYTVNFYKDSSGNEKLKLDVGWGEQNKYCFKANYIDTTHTRNISGARIAKDMVESRNESEFKTNLQNAPCNGAIDGFPIKLYINGEFYGIYTWNIPKDEWMFNMDKDNPNHLVLCAESNNNGVETNISSCEFRKTWSGVDGSEWSVEAGTLTTDLVNSFNRCVDFVMTATNEEFKNNISDYFDLDSLIDYYLFSYFVCHVDGLGKNLLMVTYDGVRWGACLYDMDSIYGAYITGSLSVATDCPCPSGYKETNSLLWARLETCFTGELKNRYAELRKGALSLGNIVSHVEEIYDKISDRMLSDEKEKWSGLPESTTNTMTRFRNYMRDRAVYVDNCMNALENIPCTSISISSKTLSIVGETPQTLTATVEPTNTTDVIVWESTNTSVASVNNGIVTPVGDGECIITVTCGEYSDTCSVNVSGISSSDKDVITLTEETTTLTLTAGKKLGDSTGEIEDDQNCNVLESYIKVSVGDSYTVESDGSFLRVYGYNGSFELLSKIVSGAAPAGTATFTIPSKVAYIRIQTYKTTTPTAIITKNNT